MDLGLVHEKVEEARRSLERMIDQEGRLISEQFNDDLTAFLAAGMSVRYAFYNANRAWHEVWEKTLCPDKKGLWDAMRNARDDESHIVRKWSSVRSGGSKVLERRVGHEEIRVGVGAPYSDASGRVESFGSPALGLTEGINPDTVILKEVQLYVIDGRDRKVTEACAEYLELLERMAADYAAANP